MMCLARPDSRLICRQGCLVLLTTTPSAPLVCCAISEIQHNDRIILEHNMYLSLHVFTKVLLARANQATPGARRSLWPFCCKRLPHVQVIDDVAGHTLAAASTQTPSVRENLPGDQNGATAVCHDVSVSFIHN